MAFNYASTGNIGTDGNRTPAGCADQRRLVERC
jgi:hypothetical protein